MQIAGKPDPTSPEITPGVGNRAIVIASFEAWKAGTGGPFDLLADECVWTIEGKSAAAGTYRGREAFMSQVIRPFNGRMVVPLRPTVRQVYSDGDTVIVHFDAHGVARGQLPYANSYVWILQLRDGRIVKASAYFDAIEFNALWRKVKPSSK